MSCGDCPAIGGTDSTPAGNTGLARHIALLGNPNAGKTTLFNLLTGARQRTGNWPGVTVERKEGYCRLDDADWQVTDLPGTYSLDAGATSEDEQIARRFVQSHPDHLYLNIIDASTLERGLYLTLQLLELQVPVLVLLNMMDLADSRGMQINIPALAATLGCPVVPVSLRREGGIRTVQQAICRYQTTSAQPTPFSISYPEVVENALSELQQREPARSRADALFALQTSDTQTDPLLRNTEKSLLSAGAKALTPAFSPLGIREENWPATVGILSGVLAKEVVVGTLDALYSQMNSTNATAPEQQPAESAYSLLAGLSAAVQTIPANLQDTLHSLGDPLGLAAVEETPEDVSQNTFSAMNQYFDGKIGAFAYLLFILMYFPCVAATGAMWREVGGRWAALGIAWSTGLGYGAATLFYQTATFSQHPGYSAFWIGLILSSFAAAVYGFYLAGNRLNTRPSPLQFGV